LVAATVCAGAVLGVNMYGHDLGGTNEAWDDTTIVVAKTDFGWPFTVRRAVDVAFKSSAGQDSFLATLAEKDTYTKQDEDTFTYRGATIKRNGTHLLIIGAYAGGA